MPEQYTLPTIAEAAVRSSGIWPSQRLHQAIRHGMIAASDPIQEAQVQPASLDLRMAEEAYELSASFLPGRRNRVRTRLANFARDPIDLTGPTTLRRGAVYLIKLKEHLTLRRRMSGMCNAKSSTGRLDIFARVITDYADSFDYVPASYSGELWVEVCPRSFDIVVRPGSRIIQLRLRGGRPHASNALLRRLDEEYNLIRGEDSETEVRNRAYILTADLMGDEGTAIVGYRARKGAGTVDVDARGAHDPEQFWEPLHRAELNNLILEPDEFHILGSRERITLPPDYAAEMVPYDTQIGEFRVHYAGFFDPGFGYGRDEDVATRAVLEVRSHEVPFSLEHGQIIGRLMLEPLLMESDKPYGAAIGSSYQQQGISLSKHFRPFAEPDQTAETAAGNEASRLFP